MTSADPLDRRSGARFMAWKWALGLGAAAVQSVVYFGVGHMKMERSTELLRTPLDDIIPFWPWTAWCYLPVYAAIFVICIVAVRSRLLYTRALFGVLAVVVVGAAGHVLIGAEYPRPPLAEPPRGISEAFLALVREVDPPGNVFPSLHVAQTSSLAFILRRDRPRMGALTIALGAVLALSTLTTKQHFLADVVSGYGIAILVSTLVLRGLPRSPAGRGPQAGAFR